MGDGERVHPHAPASPLVLDGVVEQDAEDGVHHLRDLLLLAVPRADVGQGQHPLLPHGALQETPVHAHARTHTRTHRPMHVKREIHDTQGKKNKKLLETQLYIFEYFS